MLRFISLLSAILASNSLATSEEILAVSGRHCIYFAGQPEWNTQEISNDVVANHLPPQISVKGAKEVIIQATGCTDFGVGSNCNPPNGAVYFKFSEGVYEVFGISLIKTYSSALVGVFLDDELPDPTRTPERLIAHAGAIVDNPVFQQTFFIGAGPVIINVPLGATRLFLGTHDGYGWFNNSGWLEVRISKKFLPGDVNGDGKVNIADPIYLLSYLFTQGPPPASPETAEVNCDGKVNISDPICIINYLFGQRPVLGCDD